MLQPHTFTDKQEKEQKVADKTEKENSKNGATCSGDLAHFRCVSLLFYYL